MTKTMDTDVRDLRVDPRGHNILHTTGKVVNDPAGTYVIRWTEWANKFMVNVFEDGPTFIQPIGMTSSCGYCDEYMKYDLVGETAVSQTECQYQEGITTVVEIDVPSGRLICDDDLRFEDSDVFNIEGEASYNSTLGQAQTVEALAKVGLAYGPCGNTCPSLYELEPGKYIVANPAYDEETDELLDVKGRSVAEFCTDLWAFSMMDYEAYLAAGGARIEDDDDSGTRSVIDIPAGRYQMTYHGGEISFDPDKNFDPYGSGEVVFAEFERVG